MISVTEGARRLHRLPETVRRWIRSGRPRATQHVIEEADLAALGHDGRMLPVPTGWRRTLTGERMSNWVEAVHRSREAR